MRKAMLRRRVGINAESIKAGNFGELEISYHGAKKVKLAVDTAKVAPVSAKSPPPAPPSTYSSDRLVGKGSGKGEGKDPNGQDSKRKGSQRQ